MRRNSSLISGLLAGLSLCFCGIIGAEAPDSDRGSADRSGADAERSAPRLFEVVDKAPLLKSSRVIVGSVDDLKIDLDTGLIDAAPATLAIPLGDGRLVNVDRDRFVEGKGFLSWSGEKMNEDGSLTFLHLVDHGDQVSGILNLGREKYQIVPQRDGNRASGHRLLRVQSQGSACDTSREITAQEGTAQEGTAQANLRRPAAASPKFSKTRPSGNLVPKAGALAPESMRNAGGKSASFQIDVLAIYPSSFSGAAEISLRQFITSSVELANVIFDNSAIGAHYNLVGMERLVDTDQPDVTSVQTALSWMTVPVFSGSAENAGPEEMVNLRNDYAADMVALFIPAGADGSNACGVAILPDDDGMIFVNGSSRGPFDKRAFSAHRDGCGLNDFTFAHELAHNFGMRHHTLDEASNNPEFPNGRGYSRSTAPWTNLAEGTRLTDQLGTRASGYIFEVLTEGYVVGVGGLFNGSATVSVQVAESGNFSEGAAVPGRCTEIGNNPPPCVWEYSFLSKPFHVVPDEEYAVFESAINPGMATVYHLEQDLPQTSGGVKILESFENANPSSVFGPGLVKHKDRMLGNVDIRFIPTAALSATVMACADPDPDPDTSDIFAGECARIPYFSDPMGVISPGFVLGLPSYDNASVAELQVDPFSKFRTNLAPTCEDHRFATEQGAILSLSLADIFSGALDPEGDALHLSAFTQPSNGSTNERAPGSVEYAPDRSFTGIDSFEYTISDRPEGHGAGQTATCTIEIVVGTEEVFAEVGRINALTHVPHTVILGRSYENPVVIAQTMTENGLDASVVRITDVQKDRFTLFIDEAPGLDGLHVGESVSYLVMEAGTWTLPSGAILSAGTVQTSATVGQLVSNQWQTITFDHAFDSPPIVLSQVQSRNDTTWVKTRHRNIFQSSAQLALERAEANGSTHGVESIGWVAMETADGTWSNHPFLSSRTPDQVTETWWTQSFGSGVGAPHLFAALGTYHGADNAALRYRALTTTSVDLRVQEDQTLDGETSHIHESVDFLVIGGDGSLSGISQ